MEISRSFVESFGFLTLVAPDFAAPRANAVREEKSENVPQCVRGQIAKPVSLSLCGCTKGQQKFDRRPKE
jgi:hypothetical protein